MSPPLGSFITHCLKILQVNLCLKLIIIQLPGTLPFSLKELEPPINFRGSNSTILNSALFPHFSVGIITWQISVITTQKYELSPLSTLVNGLTTL